MYYTHRSPANNGQAPHRTVLGYLRTRLLNSTLHIEITIALQQYAGSVTESVEAKI
jgi:hypothetical protein